jgi:hypothetical protein
MPLEAVRNSINSQDHCPSHEETSSPFTETSHKEAKGSLRLKNSLRVALIVALAAQTLPEITRADSGGGDNSGSQNPTFRLGFADLASQISNAGQPLENEHYGSNGDSLQQTSKGLMVWRKTDNWTAFTDGINTWVNGPNGVQKRPNSERFPWESKTQTISTGVESNNQIDELENFINQAITTESFSTVIDGKPYIIENRRVPSSDYQFTFAGEQKNQFIGFIAKEGLAKGLRRTEIIVLDPAKKTEIGIRPGYALSQYPLPQDIDKRMSHQYAYNNYIGSVGYQVRGDTSVFIFGPGFELPLENSDFVDNIIQPTLVAKFLEFVVTGKLGFARELNYNDFQKMLNADQMARNTLQLSKNR